jgi:hypothetical protein
MRKIILLLLFLSFFFVGNVAAQPEIGRWELEDGIAAVLDPENDGAQIGDEAAGRDTYYLSEPWNEYFWRFDGLIRDRNVTGDFIENGDGTAYQAIEIFRSDGTFKIHGDHLWGQADGTIYEVSVQSHFTGVNNYESDNNGGWVWKESIGTSHVWGKFKNQPFHFELTDDVHFDYYGYNDIVGHNVYFGTLTNVVMHVSSIIDELIKYFDESVEDGTIVGRGRIPCIANFKLWLFRQTLETAKYYIENDKMDCACKTLNLAFLRCDGEPRPIDYVEGEAVFDLADMILELMDELGCD